MFSTTRKRLAIFFAGLMVIFLISINVISYSLLSSMIAKDREQELIRLSAVEASVGAEQLREREEHEEKEHEDDEDKDREQLRKAGIALQSFSFVLDGHGKPIIDDKDQSRLQRDMISFLQEWVPEADDIRYQSFEYDEKHLRFVFAGQPVFEDHRYIGGVYTGVDITQETNVLQKYILILISLSALFLVVSVWLGYLMAGKAMKPIMRSFAKQQQFTADASHELRTPLSVILSSLEVIEAEEKAGFSPFSRQVLEDLKDEVKRMSQLVANLLTLARADSSDIRLNLEVFSLNDELERIYRTFQPIALQQGQQLYLTALEPLRIHADRERIVQLLFILLDNALQYSDSPGDITISAGVSGKMAAISVKDTGKGIPLEKQKEIFERFYRLDSSRNRASNHAGLGLAIAQWIAEAHRGTIKVVSVPEQGSTFTVLLPRYDHKGETNEDLIG